ncbi:MAG: hypothetical protein NC091_01115 [Bacteroides sp.]|nr:hypothetical protein [Bacteroides sp.]
MKETNADTEKPTKTELLNRLARFYGMPANDPAERRKRFSKNKDSMNTVPFSSRQLRKLRKRVLELSPKELESLEQMLAFAEEYKAGLEQGTLPRDRSEFAGLQ